MAEPKTSNSTDSTLCKMKRQRYTAAQVVAALMKAHGIQAVAAKILGCDRSTVENYIHRYATCAEAAKAGREGILDLAESKLFLNIQAGQQRAVEFTLSRIGRARGYGDRLDIGIDDAIERELARLAVSREKEVSRTAPDDRDAE